MAGRWRRDSFNSISTGSASCSRTYINTTRRVIIESLLALAGIEANSLRSVSGQLTQEHERQLTKLISMAESWNRLVKGSVVSHGDFQPIIFPYSCDFQPSHMSEYAVKPNNTDYPRISLATVELGLINRYAVGGNREPEVTVVRRATIVSEKLLFL